LIRTLVSIRHLQEHPCSIETCRSVLSYYHAMPPLACPTRSRSCHRYPSHILRPQHHCFPFDLLVNLKTAPLLSFLMSIHCNFIIPAPSFAM
jgi:hypothetical protein